MWLCSRAGSASVVLSEPWNSAETNYIFGLNRWQMMATKMKVSKQPPLPKGDRLRAVIGHLQVSVPASLGVKSKRLSANALSPRCRFQQDHGESWWISWCNFQLFFLANCSNIFFVASQSLFPCHHPGLGRGVAPGWSRLADRWGGASERSGWSAWQEPMPYQWVMNIWNLLDTACRPWTSFAQSAWSSLVPGFVIDLCDQTSWSD